LKFRKGNPLYFPYKNKDGVCEKLVDNKCSVYKDRPLVCNIQKVAKYFGSSQYIKQNIEACNRMMDEDNIPTKYRIK